MKRGRKPFTIQVLVEKGLFPENWKQVLYDIGKEGGNKTDMILALNIARDTFYRLINRSPDFSNAVNRAMEYSEKWWYDIAKKEWIKGNSKSINSQHWSLIMRNQFTERWSDKKEVDITSMGNQIKDDEIKIHIIKPDNNDE